jgi:DinB superfamily
MAPLQMLRWQFDLTWRLAGYHIPALTDEACLWEPASGSWTVRRSADGAWRPDWSDKEPDPAPPVTIGWLTWHLIWWWSGARAALRQEAAVTRESVVWPGSADSVKRDLDVLAKDWSEILSRLTESDLETQLAYPWKEPRAAWHTLAWANAELMKNISEIGVVRHLYENARVARSART